MSIWRNIDGFIKTIVRLGFAGPALKKNASINDQLDIRNNADSADGKLHAGTLKAKNFEVESTDSRKTVLSMASGAGGDLNFVFPNSDGNSGEVLGTDGSGNLVWSTPSGADSQKNANFDLAYNSSSPLSLTNLSDNSWVEKVIVDVETAFDASGCSLEIGIASDTDKYAASSEINLAAIGTYVLDVMKFEASAVQMIATFAGGSGGSAGAATIYCITSAPA